MNVLFQKKQFESQQWFELMLEYSSLENESIPVMICEFIIYMNYHVYDNFLFKKSSFPTRSSQKANKLGSKLYKPWCILYFLLHKCPDACS